MANPRLEIDLEKIAHNSKVLSDLYSSKNISICAVTKVVCSDLIIAQTLVSAGVTMIADSKIENLRKLQEEGIKSTFLLIGTPLLSQAADVVKWSNISNNSELVVIEELSRQACLEGLIHQIILMVEMGDLREGIMPVYLNEAISEVLLLEGIELVGLGTNLACLSGVRPDQQKMDLLSTLVNDIEQKFQLSFQYISGGNSANYEWYNTLRKLDHRYT